MKNWFQQNGKFIYIPILAFIGLGMILFTVLRIKEAEIREKVDREIRQKEIEIISNSDDVETVFRLQFNMVADII